VELDAIDVKETATYPMRALCGAGADLDERGGAERGDHESEEGVAAAHGGRSRKAHSQRTMARYAK
jgi:hypothetical protein